MSYRGATPSAEDKESEEKKDKRSGSFYSTFTFRRKPKIPLDELREDGNTDDPSKTPSSSTHTFADSLSPRGPASPGNDPLSDPTTSPGSAQPSSPRGESVQDTPSRNEMRKWKKHSLQQPKESNRPTVMQLMSSREEAENGQSTGDAKVEGSKQEDSFFLKKSRDRSSTTVVMDVVNESLFVSRREKIILELYKTERTYVACLETLIKNFMKPLKQLASDTKQTEVTERDIQDIFSNTEAIYHLNEDFRDKLHQRLIQWTPTTLIGDVILKMGPYLKIYTQYMNNYENSMNVLRRQLDKKQLFYGLVETYEQSPICCGLNLYSFLITPVQRIPRYVILLQELIQHTESTHVDYTNIVEAGAMMKGIAEIVNEKIREDENTRKFFSIQHKLVGFENLIQPHRRFLNELKITIGTKPSRGYTTFLLFSDTLVSTTSLAGYLHRADNYDLQVLWVATVPEDPLRLDLVTPEKTINLCANTPEEKQHTYNILSGTIDDFLTKSNSLSGPLRKGTYSSPTFGTYKGEWELGRIHGKGLLNYLNGSIYEGDWKNGMRHGKGTFTCPNPDPYTIEGDWADDRVHGQARLKSRSGMEYVGSWQQGQRDGKGQLLYPDGSICYDGDFSQGLFHGKGRLSLKNASYFDGDWVMGKRHGIGTHSNETGQYSGEWVNDQKEGQGSILYSNGDSYTGAFKEDQPNGRGILRTKAGFVYDGVITGNRIEGKGKITYPNGDEYVGDIKDGRRHGTGTLTSGLGVYSGSFNNDRKEGQGRLQFKNGDVYEGGWKEDKKYGQGTFTWANGSSYTGGFLADKKDGKGILLVKLSHSTEGYDWNYDGYFKDDKKHGPGVVYYPNGTRYEGNFVQDLRDGKAFFYTQSGESSPQYWKEGVMVRTQNQSILGEVEILHRFY